MTPILLALELGFLFALAWRCRRKTGEGMGPVIALLVWLSVYGVVTSVLGARGFYIAEATLATLPGFWVQGATVAAAVLPVLASARLRDGLRRIVDVTPWHWLAGFHALRIAALGTAFKTLQGEFPAYFEAVVGIPDLLFGLSALWVVVLARRGELGAQSFLAWNLVGVLVIVPAAPLLLQLGLPGPLQVFTGTPDARVVFTYPMSIAPVLGVPLFVLVNLWVAWRLWERGRK
jgi:hypothetical protein